MSARCPDSFFPHGELFDFVHLRDAHGSTYLSGVPRDLISMVSPLLLVKATPILKVKTVMVNILTLFFFFLLC